MVSRQPPDDVSYPARAWASLLDLDQPETNDARRITDAIAWLGEHNLLRLARKQGRPTRIYLLNDDGTADPYRPPAKLWFVEDLMVVGGFGARIPVLDTHRRV